MHITLSPVRREGQLTLIRSGDTLTIQGEDYDFSPLNDGDQLPAKAIQGDWFVGPVSRKNGALHLTLQLPHGANAPYETLFPTQITLTEDGPVELPVHDVKVEEADE